MSSVNEREISQDHVYSLKTYETLFTHVVGFPGYNIYIYIYILLCILYIIQIYTNYI